MNFYAALKRLFVRETQPTSPRWKPKSHLQIESLHNDLANGGSVTDESILKLIGDAKFSHSCEAAAMGLFAAVAPICQHRPHLIEPLLRRALDPLFCLGLDRAESISEWVDWYVQQPELPFPLSETGRTWLVEKLPQHASLVQRILDDMSRGFAGDPDAPAPE